MSALELIRHKVRNSVNILSYHFRILRFFTFRGEFASLPVRDELELFGKYCETQTPKTWANFDLEIEISIISNRPMLAQRVQKYLASPYAKVVDGSGFESFSKLCNSILKANPNKINVIIGDKCFPTKNDLECIVRLTKCGYGLVGAYKFGAFAIHPTFLRRVGYFDENFKGGGFEDSDLVIRAFESNVAVLLFEAIRYIPLKSTWKSDAGKKYFNEKWEIRPPNVPRRRNGTRNEVPLQTSNIVVPEMPLLTFEHSRLGLGSKNSGLDKYV